MTEELPDRDRIRDRNRARARARYLEEVRERLARQEQVIAHLAASGHSTIPAEKRLAALHRSLDAMLERRRGVAERQRNALFTASPGQLGPAEKGQPGSEAP